MEYAHGAYSEDDILLGIAKGEYQFWAGERSAVVTRINRYPNWTSVCFFLAGGDLEELKTMEREITQAAKDIGIQRSEVIGRNGWGGALPEYQRIATAYMRIL